MAISSKCATPDYSRRQSLLSQFCSKFKQQQLWTPVSFRPPRSLCTKYSWIVRLSLCWLLKFTVYVLLCSTAVLWKYGESRFICCTSVKQQNIGQNKIGLFLQSLAVVAGFTQYSSKSKEYGQMSWTAELWFCNAILPLVAPWSPDCSDI